MSQSRTWWGTYKLEEEQAGYWQIGPLHLLVRRFRREWVVEFVGEREPLDESSVIEVPTDRPDLGAAAQYNRFGFTRTQDMLHLLPKPGDRALIVNTERPFSLATGEEVTLYISIPLWVSVAVGKPGGELIKVPTYRPSDTWFGPSTLDGELCYATRSTARVRLHNLPRRPHRAVAAVRIRNRSNEALPLADIKIPMDVLSIYDSGDGFLWTNTIELSREVAGEMASLRLTRKPPAELTSAKLLTAPPERPQRNVLIRAFGGLMKG